MHYDPSIQLGTIFLYESESETFWAGNQDCYTFLSRINGVRSLEQIASDIGLLQNIGTEEVMDELLVIVKTLKNKNFLYAK